MHGLQIEYNVDEGKDYARNIIINGHKISHNRKNRHIHYYRWMEGSTPMYTQVTYKQGTLDIEEIENIEHYKERQWTGECNDTSNTVQVHDGNTGKGEISTPKSSEDVD